MPDDSPVLPANTSFSTKLPSLQLAVDSHSLGEFKTCPRRYYYSIRCGWQPQELGVHLKFGILVHAGREHYAHRRAEGGSHEDALLAVVEHILVETFDPQLGRPWFSGHPTKTRLTLLRTVIWDLDRFPDGDPLQTIILSSGKPAVELPFRCDSGYVSSATGESWTFCGYLDRLARLEASTYVVDVKTTSWNIDGSWFAKFTPFNQFSMYVFVGQVIWREPIAGLIVDGVQVLANSSRFERGLVPRPQPVVDEWHRTQYRWLRTMEACALDEAAAVEAGKDPAEAWPMDEMSCSNYARADGSRGGCEFREVCSKSPASRQQWLEARFVRRVWDPLQQRGL